MKTRLEQAERTTMILWIAFAIVEALLIFGVVVPIVSSRTTSGQGPPNDKGGIHD